MTEDELRKILDLIVQTCRSRASDLVVRLAVKQLALDALNQDDR